MSQVSQMPSYLLEHKVNDLEHEHGDLRDEFEALRRKCNDIDAKVDAMTKGGWDVRVGPFQDQSTAQFKHELDMLAQEVKEGLDGANKSENHGSVPPHLRASSVVSNVSSVPPHLRTKAGVVNKPSSQPPHLRNAAGNGSVVFRSVSWSGTDECRTAAKNLSTNAKSPANNPLVTDGIVETASHVTKTQDPEPTPPASPTAKFHPDDPIPSIENMTLNPTTDKNWTPYYLNTLAPLRPEAADKIPAMANMTSFAPDFLRNEFSGVQWGPGFNFVPPSGVCILPNRSYYTLDAQYEPYLPTKPGDHGAKLVPFFNENPEDVYDMDEDVSSSDNVPLFIMHKDAAGRLRYFYFGHYSQTRWSDKLDYDRMKQCVPVKVREYWAEELSAAGRPEWVTKALLKHFFPKPEYEGRMFGVSVDEGGSVMSADLEKREEKVGKDVKGYVEALREWEKDSKMRTAMIKKEFVLQAFDRVCVPFPDVCAACGVQNANSGQADADDPPALRLWWEYLECVDWRADFYNMLVTLQARNPNYERY
jgi:hypothetical protein